MKTRLVSVPKVNPKFAWYRLRIAQSSIHNWGLYTLQDIPRGKPVIEYTGKRVVFSTAQKLQAPDDEYLVHISPDILLDGRFSGSGAECINHSCNPNLIWRRSRRRVIFYSRRRIHAGEELTFRYSYPIKLTRIPCHCGSSNCRKTLRYLLA